jgi:hypothetical protein
MAFANTTLNNRVSLRQRIYSQAQEVSIASETPCAIELVINFIIS